MSNPTRFCGNEEAHESHGWARFTEDGQDFEMFACFGLPEGYYGEL